ncbi:hypothetical protein CAP31_00730 [Sulfuriferula sp. AH1]|uniref:hypothetical protein n=1 Tax=Sulfuriferula sp. AH1 TaxID=1985873 RepID=UPI000B3B9866|nr:hypothetical protein [Sulfuriferula sp. AH1]ARU30344.1 hypothetical protein CAP31_00730 [Sulfuriferula sp. AH1]
MTLITETPFAELDAQGLLLSPVFKGATTKPGRFGFRGEIALAFQESMADEKRPPEIKLDQVMMVASAGETTIPFLAGFAPSLAHLKLLCEQVGDKLSPMGKYFFFAGNLDISEKYQIPYGGATFWVMPLDEATVYNELLDMLRIEKSDLKKFDTAGKLDAIVDKAAFFSAKWKEISFEEGLKIMGPIKIRENRPV